MILLRLLSVLWLVTTMGCASAGDALGFKKIVVPPEFNQEVHLQVSDEYQKFQATRSGYDIGDLQNFHSQHTFPIVVEDSFKDLFGKVTLLKNKPDAGIEMDEPDVPAIFEVRMLDLANDISIDSAETYRSHTTIAVAMKSPSGHIFWQKAFRGDGYAWVDPQWSTGLGPEQAVVDAIRDALDQMQKAIASSPEVRLQMKHYAAIDEARRQGEVGQS